LTPAPFSVHTTAAFDREFRKLAKHHRDLIEHYRNTLVILANDPYNRSRAHNIKKLEGVAPGDGQYRSASSASVSDTTSRIGSSPSPRAAYGARTATRANCPHSKGFGFCISFPVAGLSES